MLEKFILENSEPNEIWKEIPGFEDLYMISTHGRVIAKEKPLKMKLIGFTIILLNL